MSFGGQLAALGLCCTALAIYAGIAVSGRGVPAYPGRQVHGLGTHSRWAVGVDLWQADQTGNSADATLANAGLEGVADRVEVRSATRLVTATKPG